MISYTVLHIHLQPVVSSTMRIDGINLSLCYAMATNHALFLFNTCVTLFDSIVQADPLW